jgi:hypothetical protein
MRLPQFLHEIVLATAVLDATERQWDWPDDLQVRIGPPNTANAEEAVLIVVDLEPDRAEDEAQRLRGVPLDATVVILVAPPPEQVPVATLVDILVAGGVQVLHALPVSEDDLGTVIAGRRSIGEAASIAPYLNPRRELHVTPGAALLRIMAERVVEGAGWRALEVAVGRERQARFAADRERDEARAAAAAARQQMSNLRAIHERQTADLTAKLAAADARVQRILASTSYRLVRAVSSPARMLKSRSTSR